VKKVETAENHEWAARLPLGGGGVGHGDMSVNSIFATEVGCQVPNFKGVVVPLGAEG